MRHIGNAEQRKTLLGAVDDIDRIAAYDKIEQGCGRALPTGNPARNEIVNETLALPGTQGRKGGIVLAPGGAGDAASPPR